MDGRMCSVQMRDSYSGHSFRLMALAVGVLPCVADLEVTHMLQSEIEVQAGPLQLLGIMVLTNPIKADSKDIVAELQDRQATCVFLCLLPVCL